MAPRPPIGGSVTDRRLAGNAAVLCNSKLDAPKATFLIFVRSINARYVHRPLIYSDDIFGSIEPNGYLMTDEASELESSDSGRNESEQKQWVVKANTLGKIVDLYQKYNLKKITSFPANDNYVLK
ncbi:unnamed protein product [Soboliphyme baturini]|uniref:Ras-associating domain-containing protein n=1 Tax=Soboliphyme baturini TaxID=241478 RepID=A0A183IHI0_9BILA|nr:unnamed protein product [Soboliphyme baturini]